MTEPSFWSAARAVVRQPDQPQDQVVTPDFSTMSAQEYAEFRSAHGMPNGSDIAGVSAWRPTSFAEVPPERPVMASDGRMEKIRADARMNRIAAESTTQAHGYVPWNYEEN